MTKSILDRDFVYRDSAHTDVAATIRRERKRLKELDEEQKEASERQAEKVKILKKVG